MLRSLKNHRVLATAVGFTLLSRLAGLGRELTIVGAVGVHDYTDAYFATSTIVLWVQNWAYGALALTFVPQYLSTPPDARTRWFLSQRARLLWTGGALAIVFVALFPLIERSMLGGRRALSLRHAILLATTIPASLVGGLQYARIASAPHRILPAARALFAGNVLGILALIAAVVSHADPAAVLPLSLVVAQGATMALLMRIRCDEDAHGTPHSSRTSAQGLATTIENVALNCNAVAQQAIAGTLPVGAVTINAYASRLILLPLTGIIQPLQQRLFISFASSTRGHRHALLTRAVVAGLAVGTASGIAVAGVVTLGHALLPPHWQELTASNGAAVLALSYGIYAGVMIANQTLARYFFSQQRGWAYSLVAVGAYALGTTGKVLLVRSLGTPALPLCALCAEGAATALLLLLSARVDLELATPTRPAEGLPS